MRRLINKVCHMQFDGRLADEQPNEVNDYGKQVEMLRKAMEVFGQLVENKLDEEIEQYQKQEPATRIVNEFDSDINKTGMDEETIVGDQPEIENDDRISEEVRMSNRGKGKARKQNPRHRLPIKHHEHSRRRPAEAAHHRALLERLRSEVQRFSELHSKLTSRSSTTRTS